NLQSRRAPRGRGDQLGASPAVQHHRHPSPARGRLGTLLDWRGRGRARHAPQAGDGIHPRAPDEDAAGRESAPRALTGAGGAAVRALTLRRRRQYHPSPGVNLVGIGIGEKIVAARPTSELCVKVLVARKYPRGRISRGDRIPASVGGVPVDVEGVGYVRKFQPPNQQRRRPVPGGVSGSLAIEAVGFRYAGTLGVIVVDRDHRDVVYALSNNHVLANENRAAVGAGAVQPATLDGGRPTDRVAALDRFVPLRYNNEPNRMDAAI